MIEERQVKLQVKHLEWNIDNIDIENMCYAAQNTVNNSQKHAYDISTQLAGVLTTDSTSPPAISQLSICVATSM